LAYAGIASKKRKCNKGKKAGNLKRIFEKWGDRPKQDNGPNAKKPKYTVPPSERKIYTL